MSIINDALKKAERQSGRTPKDTPRILHDIGGIQNESKNGLGRRWFLWSGTLIICALMFLLVSPTQTRPVFQVRVAPVVEPEVVSEEVIELAAEPLPQANTFNLRQIDFELVPSEEDFTVNGIVYDQQRPLAIVNNKIVTVGSLVDGARLLEIRPDHVKLSYREEEFTVRLK